MTTVEVLYSYAAHPSEAAMLALGNTREIYGIRRIKLDAAAKTIRVEYDATRLSRVLVANLLRRAGINITEEISLIPPLPEAIPAPASAPVQPSVATTAAPGSAAQPPSSAPALAK